MPPTKRLILALCGHKPPCRDFDFGSVSSILIRPFGLALGDAMIHLAFAAQIKAVLPEVRLGVIVGRNRDIFACSPLFDQLIPATLGGYWRNRKKWQLLLDFSESFNTPDLIADKILSPQAVMIFSKGDKTYYNHQTISNYDFRCPFNPKNHISRHLKTSLLAQHFALPPALPHLSLPKHEIQQARTLWPQQAQIKILLAPQGHPRLNKHIPPAELAQVLNNGIMDAAQTGRLSGRIEKTLPFRPDPHPFTPDHPGPIPCPDRLRRHRHRCGQWHGAFGLRPEKTDYGLLRASKHPDLASPASSRHPLFAAPVLRKQLRPRRTGTF